MATVEGKDVVARYKFLIGDAERNVNRMTDAIKRGAQEQRSAMGRVPASIEMIGVAFDEARRKSEYFYSALNKGANTLLGVGAAGIAFSGWTTKSAMDAIEAANLFEVTFDKNAKAANAWSENLAKTYRRNVYSARQYMGDFAAVLKPVLGSDQAYEMSKGLTKLAYDLESFRNIPIDEVITRLQSGMAGETEAVRRLGMDLSDTTLKQYAFTHGIGGGNKELTEAEKRLTRYRMMLEQTGDATDDVTRTMNEPANRLRALNERWAELRVTLGQGVIPILERLMGGAERIMTTFDRMDDAQKRSIGRFIAWGGGIALAVGAGMKLLMFISQLRGAVLLLTSAKALDTIVTDINTRSIGKNSAAQIINAGAVGKAAGARGIGGAASALGGTAGLTGAAATVAGAGVYAGLAASIAFLGYSIKTNIADPARETGNVLKDLRKEHAGAAAEIAKGRNKILEFGRDFRDVMMGIPGIVMLIRRKILQNADEVEKLAALPQKAVTEATASARKERERYAKEQGISEMDVRNMLKAGQLQLEGGKIVGQVTGAETPGAPAGPSSASQTAEMLAAHEAEQAAVNKTRRAIDLRFAREWGQRSLLAAVIGGQYAAQLTQQEELARAQIEHDRAVNDARDSNRRELAKLGLEEALKKPEAQDPAALAAQQAILKTQMADALDAAAAALQQKRLAVELEIRKSSWDQFKEKMQNAFELTILGPRFKEMYKASFAGMQGQMTQLAALAPGGVGLPMPNLPAPGGAPGKGAITVRLVVEDNPAALGKIKAIAQEGTVEIVGQALGGVTR